MHNDRNKNTITIMSKENITVETQKEDTNKSPVVGTLLIHCGNTDSGWRTVNVFGLCFHLILESIHENWTCTPHTRYTLPHPFFPIIHSPSVTSIESMGDFILRMVKTGMYPSDEGKYR